ncbi:hypothetical protein P7M41_26990 [Vibrio parahaemolyticus]|nr:hypothetical protein [Vibrio parahaemolyticus]
MPRGDWALKTDLQLAAVATQNPPAQTPKPAAALGVTSATESLLIRQGVGAVWDQTGALGFALAELELLQPEAGPYWTEGLYLQQWYTTLKMQAHQIANTYFYTMLI